MVVELLQQTGGAIVQPLYVLWLDVINILPNLIAAIIVLIIGYFVGLALGHVVKVILEKIGLNKWIKNAKLSKALGHTNVPGITGELFKWYIFIIFLQQAVSLVNLGEISSLLNTLVLWLPNLLVAVVVVLVGLALAHYVEIKVTEHSKLRGLITLTKALKVVIILLVALIALRQIGVNVGILENTFLIVVAGISLAFAIAFGSASKKDAAELMKKFKKNF
jgi:hypothetical protein